MGIEDSNTCKCANPKSQTPWNRTNAHENMRRYVRICWLIVWFLWFIIRLKTETGSLMIRNGFQYCFLRINAMFGNFRVLIKCHDFDSLFYVTALQQMQEKYQFILQKNILANLRISNLEKFGNMRSRLLIFWILKFEWEQFWMLKLWTFQIGFLLKLGTV